MALPAAQGQAALAILVALAASAAAQPLELFEEEAAFVTASRRPESRLQAPASILVITRQEIAESGANSIADALRFRAGLNVVDARSGDGNRRAVSVRGFPREFANDLQVLIDGRSAYDPILGGTFWDALPVQLEDVERIEVVRGPAASLYGANAGLGVVNVITRKPSGRRPRADVRAGNRVQRAFGAAEAPLGGGHVRFSASRLADSGERTPAGAAGNDHFRGTKANVAGAWGGERSGVEARAGVSHNRLGFVLPTNPSGAQRFDFQSLRAWRGEAPGRGLELTLSRQGSRIAAEPFPFGRAEFSVDQRDAEAVWRGAWADEALHASAGASVRDIDAFSDQLFRGRSRQRLTIPRAFSHLRWRPVGPLSLAAGGSVEDAGLAGAEWSHVFAAVLQPSPEHALRLRHGLSPTIPTLFQRAGDLQFTPLVRFVGNPLPHPEEVTCTEAGWAAHWLSDRLKTDLGVYYMDVDGRITPQPPTGAGVLTFGQAGRVLARGLEASASWTGRRGDSLGVNWTWERVTGADGTPRAPEQTPRHQANLLAAILLGRGWRLSGQAGFRSQHYAWSSSRRAGTGIPGQWRVDARLGYTHGDVEVYLAGQNLQGGRGEFADGLRTSRTVQLGTAVEFGAP